MPFPWLEFDFDGLDLFEEAGSGQDVVEPHSLVFPDGSAAVIPPSELPSLLLDVPHRQVVFTIPKMLRTFFKYNRRLLGALCSSAVRSLSRYFEEVTGTRIRPGVIASIQAFGDRINLHPHAHLLVTEGGQDSAGKFHHLAEIEDSLLAEFFQREALSHP